MLKPAQLYKDRLTEEYIKTWYKPEKRDREKCDQ